MSEAASDVSAGSSVDLLRKQLMAKEQEIKEKDEQLKEKDERLSVLTQQ